MGWRGKVAVTTLVVVLLMVPSLASLAGAAGGGDDGRSRDRDSWTVKRFDERSVPVDINFEASVENSTYHLSLPNTGTVTSASITLEGLERYSLTGTPNDFGDLPSHSHIAHSGEDGKYPPTTSPSNYNQLRFDETQERDVSKLDGTSVTTDTPQGFNPPPLHHPYHMFDLIINRTGMVRLKVEWHGYGQNPNNATNTNGAEVFLWNYTGESWLRLGGYGANDTPGQVRSVTRTMFQPYDFTDRYGHVNVLVFGMHDEKNPQGWPYRGQVATDYVAVTVLRNDTLEWTSDVSLAIGDGTPVWSVSGRFTSTVTLDDSSGLRTALQAYVDGIPPAPQPVTAPFVFEVAQRTWGLVRVTALSVSVREVDNQPPVSLGVTEVAMTEDVDLAKGLDLALYFDDDHNGADLDYAVDLEENASAVHAVIHTDGHSVNFLTAADDWAGTLRFRFSATDVWGLETVSGDFTVTVAQVNDPPTIEDPGDVFIDEDVPFELNLSFNDPDLPYGDELTFTDDAQVFDVDPATGRIAFTPGQADVGRYNVTVTVHDREGGSDSVRFVFVVNNVNDRPVIIDPGVLVAYEDRLFELDFVAVDEDGDRNFNWLLVGGVGTMVLGAQSGWFSWIPEGSHVGHVNVSIIASDRKGAADQINVTIQVVNVNDPPVLAELRPAQLTEGEPFKYTVKVTDPDLGETTSESHTFTVDPPLFTILPSGSIDFTPGNDEVGTHHVNVTVRDAALASHTLPWVLEVANVNQPPTLEKVPEQLWQEDEPVLLALVASDPDRGDRLTFSDYTSMFSIDPRTGVINFTPVQSNAGKHELRIRVQDAAGLYAEIYITVTIAAVNDPPVVTLRVEMSGDRLVEGDSLSLAAEADDEDNRRSELQYLWFLDGKQVGEGTDTLDLHDLRPGEHTVEVRVSDGEHTATATHSFSVEELETSFPWMSWLVAIVVVIVVVVVALKVVMPAFKRVTEEPHVADARPAMVEPEVTYDVAAEEENPFEGWRGS